MGAWRRNDPNRTIRRVILVGVLAMAAAGCAAPVDDEAQRLARFTSTAEGRAIHAAFMRDRSACARIAERITPLSERYVAFSGGFRQEWVEKQIFRCMLARGWKDGSPTGWERGKEG